MATQHCDVAQTLENKPIEMPVRNVVDRAVQTELNRNVSNASELSHVRSCLCVDRFYVVQVRIKVADAASRPDVSSADVGDPPCCFPQLGLCGKRSKEQVRAGPRYTVISIRFGNFKHSLTFLRVPNASSGL